MTKKKKSKGPKGSKSPDSEKSHSSAKKSPPSSSKKSPPSKSPPDSSPSKESGPKKSPPSKPPSDQLLSPDSDLKETLPSSLSSSLPSTPRRDSGSSSDEEYLSASEGSSRGSQYESATSHLTESSTERLSKSSLPKPPPDSPLSPYSSPKKSSPPKPLLNSPSVLSSSSRKDRESSKDEEFGEDREQRQLPTITERLAQVSEHILIRRTQAHEVIMHVNTMPLNPRILIADDYDPNQTHSPSCRDISYLKKVYATNVERITNNFIKSTTIIGWSEENSETFYMKQSLCGLHDNVVPFTYTIFPVIVMGENEDPVIENVLRQCLPYYNPSVYLVLYGYKHKSYHTKQLLVVRDGNEIAFENLTFAAELQYWIVYVKKDGSCSIRRVGTVKRILDINNAAHCVYGMYAGGPLPPASRSGTGNNRITWDQPQDKGFSEGRASIDTCFRHEIDHQKFTRRVGFFCGKDGNLFVTESRLWHPHSNPKQIQTEYYHSLLKDYTYVISDGYNSWVFEYPRPQRKRIPFKDKSDKGLEPKIVIVPEGVSGLNICVPQHQPNFRSSEFFNHEPYDYPIIIDWFEFENTFAISPPIPYAKEHLESVVRQHQQQQQQPIQEIQPNQGMQQIMSFRDINDCIRCPIPSLNRIYLFSIKQEPLYFPHLKKFEEYWHVYGQLYASQTDQIFIYYYLGTVSISYVPSNYERDRKHRYDYTHFYREPFPIAIDHNLYPNLPEECIQTAQQMAQEWKTIIRNQDFKKFVKQLIKAQKSRFQNAGVLTHRRFYLMANNTDLRI